MQCVPLVITKIGVGIAHAGAADGLPCVQIGWKDSSLALEKMSAWDIQQTRRIAVGLLEAAQGAEDQMAKNRGALVKGLE